MPMQKPAIVGPARFPQLVFCAVVAFAFGAGVARGQECYYTWERIRDSGGGYCSGSALNNHGVVAGTISYVGDNTRAFTWSADTGLVILPLPPGHSSMSANGINDLGQVVGPLGGINGPGGGFIWDMNTQTYTIIDLPPFSFEIYVNDINNRGEVVGSLFHRYPPALAFWDPYIWQYGEWTFFGDFTGPGSAYVNAINELGDMAGDLSVAGFERHAFVIRERGTIEWLPEPPGFFAASAHALSNNGTLVGLTSAEEPLHGEGIAWTPWGVDVYPPISSVRDASLSGVNDSHRAVGRYKYGDVDRALVAQYGTATILRNLVAPTPPWLYGATAINNSGQIVAGYNGGALLLTPHWLEGDLTGDCHVGLEDLAILLIDFGAQSGSYAPGDINGDTAVDLVDLAVLLSHFGE